MIPKTEIAFLFTAGSGPAPKPWHINDTFETSRIYFIENGSAFFSAGGFEYRLSAGHLYFFPPNLRFCVRDNPNEPVVHMYFDFVMTPPVILDRFLDYNLSDERTDRSLKPLLFAAGELLRSGRYETYHSTVYTPVTACLSTIISVILTSGDFKCVSDECILKALNIIHAGYASKISVSDIASRLSYSTDCFIRRFKAATGATPYAYIKALKLHEAVKLREHGVKYAEIAGLLGYSDASSLCHMLEGVDFKQ